MLEHGEIYIQRLQLMCPSCHTSVVIQLPENSKDWKKEAEFYRKENFELKAKLHALIVALPTYMNPFK